MGMGQGDEIEDAAEGECEGCEPRTED